MFIRTFGDNESGVVQLEERIPQTMNMNPLAIVSKNWSGLAYYSEEGRKFGLKPTDGHVLSPAWLWWLLSDVLTKPRIVSFETVDLGMYSLDDLKATIRRWLKRVDDILTQFLDVQQIRHILSNSKTFDDMLWAVRAINGQHETDRDVLERLREIGVPDLEPEEDE